MEAPLPIQVYLDWEINNSWFAGYISNPWLQDKIASYYVWKVKRKYARYKRNYHIYLSMKIANDLVIKTTRP